MEKLSFNEIAEKLRRREITESEAGELFNALKSEKRRPSPVQKYIPDVVEPAVSAQTDEIAVVGMAGQFPDAPDVYAFWRNLVTGHDAVHELPSHYLEQRLYYSDKKESGKTYCKWGGILENRDCFDPLFFNISPREAESMNPHQRLILQQSWQALEDAGYNPKKLTDSEVGMFIGAEPTGWFRETFTGSSEAIIASRLSYYLNLRGPALVVNTGCSSSGTAIHLACESLRNGESSLAVAAGILANLGHSVLVTLSQIEMLSPTGRCATFDESADGTVLSEGVGVVVLKRLREAVADGDHIYGVICGSGMNQDGASNGITAPNGVAQEQLISRVYRRYGINPQDITYMEAHGTGTGLGDPIEANALARTFKQFTAKEHYCAIGSAKSYIGHTGAAAGAIGLIKILLSMQYRKIPGLIHFKKLNPLIEFQGSAFFVNTDNLAWQMEPDRPLMAGLSSFGHSGTNVHLVVREYRPKISAGISSPIHTVTPALLPLSARNAERLQEYAARMAEFLKQAISRESGVKINLQDVAYTLQTGREEMEERVAFLAGNLPEFLAQLETFQEGLEIPGCRRGRTRQGKDLKLFASGDALRETVANWMQNAENDKIAELWVQGYVIDWELFYRGIRPKRLSLPTYPFARERYRIPESAHQTVFKTGNDLTGTYIHPLLQQNTSDLTALRYSSLFTGEEFFLKDHIIQERRILPGVAYLEMARAAVEQAVGADCHGVLRFKNVVWIQPLMIREQPVRVHVGLFPEPDGTIAYDIYSEPITPGAEPLIHSQGAVMWGPVMEVPNLDLTGLQVRCNSKIYNAGQCYEAFKAMGVSYGPGHRGLETVYAGEDQVLAKIFLSDPASALTEYVLHPGLLDSALQAMIGFKILDTGSVNPALPFALEEMEILGACSSVMWVTIRYSDGSKPGDKVEKLDLDICDETGKVCIRMKGYSSRVPEDGGAAIPGTITKTETLLLQPCWNEETVTGACAGEERADTEFTQHLIILCEPGDLAPEMIESRIKGFAPACRCLNLGTQEKGIAQRFQAYTIRVFEEIQKLLRDKFAGQLLIQIVVSGEDEGRLLGALRGLLQTARLENPGLIGQLIELDFNDNLDELAARLNESGIRPHEQWIRYQDGKRMTAGWSELEISRGETGIPWKDGGIYLITGGAGGLGMIFASEIAKKVKKPTLILTGRTALTGEKQARIRELDLLGASVIYQQVDVTQTKAVDDLIQDIRVKRGGLNGIIHSAGVIRDNYLLKKTMVELQEVLAPKTVGLVNLDQATKDMDLDFFVLFSSVAGALGNSGQADYAAANAFMDLYAGYRNALAASKQRRGRTFAMNWPLWQDGGMSVTQETEHMMIESTGMFPMGTRDGIEALYQGIASGQDRVMALHGDLSRIRTALLEHPVDKKVSIPSLIVEGEIRVLPMTGELLREKAINYFKNQLSGVLKLPAHQIDAGAPMEKYGIDSIMVMQLTNQLEKSFGSLSKTLFFEYRNIEELTAYFLEAYGDRLSAVLGIEEAKPASHERARELTIAPEFLKSPAGHHRRPRFTSRSWTGGGTSQPEKALDVAIIGLSGRYPQAGNIQEFWGILRDGKDCITEIPKERWDHGLYFDEDRNKPGKTYSKWGGFLEGVDRFDPLFFNISPLEAEMTDPQERLFLECVYETLEDAGYTRDSLGSSGGGGNVGVYVGVMYEEYQLYGALETLQGKPTVLAGNSSLIANRVSYYCNFHGPSMAIDTMCSSSLTAIHLACQGLQQGGCELAIAGGVNVSIHPNKYLMLAQGRFASSKGRCESFGEGGDGYVPGEGVGAVLLKPLSRALNDGDHIYGIIKGTAINHGGKTNGFTVPNPNAQAAVIGRALKEARVDPRTITYLEAHGTGTSLGDPIEITGLTKTFREYTQDKHFCAIGSVKSNIGHCESAAGIAGVTKVLLQFKYGLLAPSLHSRTLNPNIDFSNTPFTVQQELAEWKRPLLRIQGEAMEYPRRAGISSFGAGGSNAHVVIEEYISHERECVPISITARNPALIVLSARNEEQLKEQAGRLLAAIRARQFSESDLADMAYTLQVGREAMEERLAFIASSLGELEKKLAEFGEGQENIAEIYRGQAKDYHDALSVFTDEDLQKAIVVWISKGKYGKLLELWVKGLNFDWTKLYSEKKPCRLSLPTYPFARERCWAPVGANDHSPLQAPIHPLLHQNTSNFSEQRFTTTFTGREFFLADHRVRGQRILPAAVYLEMARAAVRQTLGTPADVHKGMRLKDITWDRPIVVREMPVQIHIGLIPEESALFGEGEIAFEIYSIPETKGMEPIIHSRGRVVLDLETVVPTLDLKGLQAGCNRTLSSAQCYDAFNTMGIEYGEGHRGIEAVYTCPDLVLAKLSLPAAFSGTQEQFMMHPAMMDAALQASIGFAIDSGGVLPIQPLLPFALEGLEIFLSCTPVMWALVQHSKGSRPGDKVQKLDFDLCDETGRVSVRMRGFAAMAVNGVFNTNDSQMIPAESNAGLLMLTPVWDAVTPVKVPLFPPRDARLIMIGGIDAAKKEIGKIYPQVRFLEVGPEDSVDTIAEKLELCGSIHHILWITPFDMEQPSGDDALMGEQDQGVIRVFRIVKALLRLGYETRELGLSLTTIQALPIREDDRLNPAHASLCGFAGSLAKEYPNWQIRCLDLEATGDWPFAEIFTLPPDPLGNPLGYRNREWYQERLLTYQSPAPDHSLYKPGGVYVVIGGAGGIGEAWSEYMIRTYRAQVIWLGRREMDETIRVKLDRLSIFGPAPCYIAADATNLAALTHALQEIKERYSHINGVIHSAIVLADQSLAKMSEERFRAGLAAKVDVSVLLAKVFQREPLDFIMFFSSMNSFFKAAGQSNYAAGCTFTDAFARQLGRQLPYAVKVMNWGYWGSTGSVSSEEYQARMAKNGIGSIEAREAMEALEVLLAGPATQTAFLKITKSWAMKGLNPTESITVYPQTLESGILAVVTNGKRIRKTDSQMRKALKSAVRRMNELDLFLCWMVRTQLDSLGLLTVKNPKQHPWAQLTDFNRFYEQWLEEIPNIPGWNHDQKDGGSSGIGDDGDTVWAEWEQRKELWLADPELKARVVLADAMLRALPEILYGKARATEIMFPDSSTVLVEGIYKNNIVADYYNELLADAVLAYVEERIKHDESARIRLIEIGAGSGGVSVSVFRKLAPYRDHIQEYCYTDLSRAFLIHAENEYGPGNPYLTYQIFNVEKPLEGQGIPEGGYDLAIASNVLHATKNIRRTLRNTKAVLKKHGLLLLNELNGKSMFAHLTFGLLEGWWLYEDPVLRIPGSPGLLPETWQAVLTSEGFKPVSFLGEESRTMGQQIIAVESDGIVRQERTPIPVIVKIKQQLRPVVNREEAPRPDPERRWTSESPIKQRGEYAPELLREKSTDYIKNLIGETLKIPGHKIDAAAPLEKYGIDSILVVQLTNALSKKLDHVGSTLFFEYQTIDALVEHFLETQKETLLRLTGLENKAPETASINADPDLPQTAHVHRLLRRPGHFIESRIPNPRIAGTHNVRIFDVAVIGLSGRYPGANNIDEFWNRLKEGRNGITEIPPERFDWKEYYDAQKGKRGSIYTKWGGFINDIARFDSLFFRIAPREAEQMDPQERLFLETAYASIEDAGYTPSTLCESRKVGVFVGAMNGNYPSGASFWSIANRISYLFNFQGPSMAVDTACSSSLSAIHLALESLYGGASECAVAGGVNLIVDPKHYLRLAAMNMLSAGDRCRPFGEEADGFVAGEGVGALVLKPLSQAVADGDHIYGVIKGSMLNAGGKTNGYTVPNPRAQAQLISDALKRAGAHARTISYLEAHGTGTSLGDPIEIAGLAQAFASDTEDKQFCAIGSVKSNIGHGESAAGIAGVTKVLLQLKYRQLAPSLHAETLNSNIDFSNTPFFVQQTLAEWENPTITMNGETGAYPRIAGISSFGAGGANAHIVFSEYVPEEPARPHLSAGGGAVGDPAVIVLSAMNEERLRECTRRLLEFIRRGFSALNLHDIAYTLQVGREAMEERLAVVTGSVLELEEKLEQFLSGRDDISAVYRGQVERNKETIAALTANEEMRETIQKWIEHRKLGILSEFWVKGLNFDWQKLYDGMKPGRLSLPTYPFSGERYWIHGSNLNARGSAGIAMVDAIHPLLQQNTSSFLEQCFSSTFTGREFFITARRLNDKRILPEAACLEMARAAVEQSTGVSMEKGARLRLKDIVWEKPITVGEEPLNVHIGLFPDSNVNFTDGVSGECCGEIAYEIYGGSGEDRQEPVVYSRGKAILYSASVAIPTLDLTALQAGLSLRSSVECSAAFQATGVDNGPGNRVIEILYQGSGQVLAKLSLPTGISGASDRFVLHPVLMEGALQASLILRTDDGITKPFRLYMLEELELFKRFLSEMWAWIRYRDGSGTEEGSLPVDIDLCDAQGEICIQMKGIRICADSEDQIQSFTAPGFPLEASQATFELMTFEEVWLEEDLPGLLTAKGKTLVCFLSQGMNQQEAVETVQTLDRETQVVFISQDNTYRRINRQLYQICGDDGRTYEEAFRSIREDYGEVDAILYLRALEDSGCIRDYACIIYILQAIATSGLKAGRFLLVGEFSNGLERCYLESWIGFERSLGLVLPHTQVGAVLHEAGGSTLKFSIKDWLWRLWPELHIPKAVSVLYREGKRHTCRILPAAMPPGKSLPRKGGTYLITGGCGGLGYLFAKHCAVNQVNLILTGRSPLDAAIESKLKSLEALGSRVMYIRADVIDQTAMQEGLSRAKACFWAIHGVIHAAGIAGHQSVFHKTIEDFQKVLDPKIKGTLALDEALDGEPLDFICYFSSSAAILGDFGNCDYAVGNRFQTVYAHYRNLQQIERRKYGKAFVINWPLWKNGGMGFGDDEKTNMYLKSSGQRSLETQEGLDVFDRILAQEKTQILVLKGEPWRVHRFLGLIPQNSTQALSTIEDSTAVRRSKGRRAEMKGWGVEQCLEWDLKEHIGQLLKISRSCLKAETNLADFGFDSVSLTEFATLLTGYYGIEITPSLFYGYATIAKLTLYFLTEYQAEIQEFYREEAGEAVNPLKMSFVTRNKLAPRARFARGNAFPEALEPIAVIGISGRFPQADTVGELWENLKQGKNCIAEIPEERWDWREYYGDPHQEPGKSSSKWGGFINSIDRFEPLFFEISPKEAEMMDPKQRLFLEEAWHALEDAGYMGKRIKGKSCGVYVGVEEGEYGILSCGSGEINSNQNATLSARIAYFLDLKGPNLALTASCSSGLVAVHQACQALRQGDCEMAVAGGIHLLISPRVYLAMGKMEMLASDGKCYIFDRRAGGLVPGEAVAVVLLKPLSKAIRDKDRIYGCIKASGVNYNGRSNGITAPNPLSQAELLQNIYEKYHIRPDDIQYMLAHSVGSKMGDPVEIQALTSAFGKYTNRKQYCGVGSVKPLIGHTFAASGVVGLISMLMAMKDQVIPALHNFETSNAYINFAETQFFPVTANQIWRSKDNRPRMGAVSTTGISGANAHAVIEEYLPAPTAATIGTLTGVSPQLVVFSAKNRERLRAMVQQNYEFIGREMEIFLPDLAYTLQIGREEMESRVAMVVQNREELVRGMKTYLESLSEGKELEAHIPIFTGEAADEESRIDIPHSRIAEDSGSQELIRKKNLRNLALHWVNGGKIPWELLHQGKENRIITLPGYPFAGERYWISTKPEDTPILLHRADFSSPGMEKKRESSMQLQGRSREDFQDYIAGFFSRELNLAPERIKSHKNMREYGVDSIVIMKLTRDLEKRFKIRIAGREMMEHVTINSLAAYLAERSSESIHRESAEIEVPVCETDPRETKACARNVYRDDQVIEVLERCRQGTLTFEEALRRIERGEKA